MAPDLLCRAVKTRKTHAQKLTTTTTISNAIMYVKNRQQSKCVYFVSLCCRTSQSKTSFFPPAHFNVQKPSLNSITLFFSYNTQITQAHVMKYIFVMLWLSLNPFIRIIGLNTLAHCNKTHKLSAFMPNKIGTNIKTQRNKYIRRFWVFFLKEERKTVNAMVSSVSDAALFQVKIILHEVSMLIKSGSIKQLKTMKHTHKMNSQNVAALQYDWHSKKKTTTSN